MTGPLNVILHGNQWWRRFLLRLGQTWIIQQVFHCVRRLIGRNLLKQFLLLLGSSCNAKNYNLLTTCEKVFKTHLCWRSTFLTSPLPIGSIIITSHCSGKWAHTQDQRPDLGDERNQVTLWKGKYQRFYPTCSLVFFPIKIFVSLTKLSLQTW